MISGNSVIGRGLGRTHPLAVDVKGSAKFSNCGNYRFYLSRGWGEGPTIMWLCINPSSATDLVDDDTSRKLTRHSRRLGFGRLFLLNVMDYRATDPDQLPLGGEVSPANIPEITRCARWADTTVLAFGRLRNRRAWKENARRATDACGGNALMRAVANGDGSPRHPVMFPREFQLERHQLNPPRV